MNILLLHGSNQNNENPIALKFKWYNSINNGLSRINVPHINNATINMPFYGKTLYNLAQNQYASNNKYAIPYNTFETDFITFIQSTLDDLSVINTTNTALTKTNNIKSFNKFDIYNIIIDSIDNRIPLILRRSICFFLKDAYFYIFHSGIKTEIDNLIRPYIINNPTIIIAHSLGSVIAYNILRNSNVTHNIPILISLGSPLGLKLIRNEFSPTKFPKTLTSWHNIINKNDYISTKQLNANNFPTEPNITNHFIFEINDPDPHSVYNYLQSNTFSHIINKYID